MRIIKFCLAALFLLSIKTLFAADQSVTIVISAINELSVSGNPGTLTINSATAGSEPDDATDATTTYSMTTNEGPKKITGQITGAGDPTAGTLKATLSSIIGTSAGIQTLISLSTVDLVTAISSGTDSTQTITYTYSATASEGTMVSETKTVTLTLTT